MNWTRKSVNLQNWLVYLKVEKRSNVLVLALAIHIN